MSIPTDNAKARVASKARLWSWLGVGALVSVIGVATIYAMTVEPSLVPEGQHSFAQPPYRSDVDLHHLEVLVDVRVRVRRVQVPVQSQAVGTPVGAERDHQHLAARRGAQLALRDRGARIEIGAIRRLAERGRRARQ